MDTYNAIVNFFQEGGMFMYPILVVFALGIAIAIERYIYLTLSKNTNQRAWKQIIPLVKDGRIDQANTIINKSRAALCKILSYGMDRIRQARRRDDIETALEEGLMEFIPRLEKRTHYLAILANIATLLGLLGTIMGLIDAFKTVSGVDPSQKAELLSSAISVAMNTTAFGLMVAIPLLVVHTVLTSKTGNIVNSLEMASVKVLNVISSASKRCLDMAA